MSWSSYKLNSNLIDGLINSGFAGPTDIQENCLAFVSFPVDLIIAAKTVCLMLIEGLW